MRKRSINSKRHFLQYAVRCTKNYAVRKIRAVRCISYSVRCISIRCTETRKFNSIQIQIFQIQIFKFNQINQVCTPIHRLATKKQRAQTVLFQLPVYRHHSVKISAQSIQPFKRSLRGRKKKKKQESTVKAYNIPRFTPQQGGLIIH